MANALLLGGGAPTLTLQSGALAAFHEHGAKFHAVSTAGAGMVIGLLYAAPKHGDVKKALEDTREMGVDDTLYGMLPVNFKVFFKPGAAAASWRAYLASLPRFDFGKMPYGRFWSDWWALAFSTLSPSDLAMSSLGLCEHAPWIDEIVDFDKLKKNFKGEFYMNAYCIDDQEMQIFSKDEIGPDHFRAALAFPLIYPPFELNGKTYIEGSALDTLCFRGLLKYREKRLEEEKGNRDRENRLAVHQPLEHVVVFDVLSSDRIIRKPRNLYDAWIQSIMIPLVEIAKDDIEIFQHKYNKPHPDTGREPLGLKLHRLQFEIPDAQWPYVLDWSYSNLKTLYDVGYASGDRFCRDPENRWLFDAPEPKTGDLPTGKGPKEG
jgi:predicted acylesterase/phospholipase RssA